MSILIIREVMRRKGLTTTELAKKLGVTRETIQRQIRGTPNIETIQRYAEALEVDITELFSSCNIFRSNKKEEVSINAVCPHCGKHIKIEKAE